MTKKRDTKGLTELELQIMRSIWRSGDEAHVSVEEIRDALEQEDRPLALPSVRTMVKILGKKGYLKRHKEGRKHLYTAVVSEEDGKQGILADVVEKAFDGSSLDLVASLLGSNMVREGDLEKVKSMLNQLEDGSTVGDDTR